MAGSLLYAVASGSSEGRWDKANIVVQSIGSNERQVVVRGGGAPRYVATGHLLYLVGATMLAVPFDPKTATVGGGPVAVVEGVTRALTTIAGAAQFAVSDTGTLALRARRLPTGPNALQTPALLNRDGTARPLPTPPNRYQAPRVSPDGRQVVVATDRQGGRSCGFSRLVRHEPSHVA